MNNNTTTIIIDNGALDMIETDENFGRNLASAIKFNYITGKSINVAGGSHIAAATVIEQHPHDDTVVITVGAKYGSVFSKTIGFLIHHTEEAKIEILRDIAYRLGFFLRRRVDVD